MNDEIIKQTEEKMNKSLEVLDKKFTTVRAGRANGFLLWSDDSS